MYNLPFEGELNRKSTTFTIQPNLFNLCRNDASESKGKPLTFSISATSIQYFNFQTK